LLCGPIRREADSLFFEVPGHDLHWVFGVPACKMFHLAAAAEAGKELFYGGQCKAAL